MKRLLLTLLLLLLTAPPVRAEASIAASVERPIHAFRAADENLYTELVRSVDGLELLLELSHRVRSPVTERESRAPRRPRDPAPREVQLQLASRASRVAMTRGVELLCDESPYQVYLPYHAHPPPHRS